MILHIKETVIRVRKKHSDYSSIIPIRYIYVCYLKLDFKLLYLFSNVNLGFILFSWFRNTKQ